MPQLDSSGKNSIQARIARAVSALVGCTFRILDIKVRELKEARGLRARWLFRGHPERRSNCPTGFARTSDRLAPFPSLHGAMSTHYLQAHFVELDPAKPEDYELCCLVIDATIAYRQKLPLPVVETVGRNPQAAQQHLAARTTDVREAYKQVLRLFQQAPAKVRFEKAWLDWQSRHSLAFAAQLTKWINSGSPVLHAYLKILDKLADDLVHKHEHILGIQTEIKNQEENQSKRHRFKQFFKSQKTPGPDEIARACAECTALLVRTVFHVYSRIATR